MHILFEGLEIDLFLALRVEEEGEARAIVVVFGSDDLDFPQPQFGGAGAAIDHGFRLFGLPGLEQQQIAWGGAPLHGPPAAFRFRRRFLDELDDFAQVPAA